MSCSAGSTPRSGHKYFFVVSISTGFRRPVLRWSPRGGRRAGTGGPTPGGRGGREAEDGREAAEGAAPSCRRAGVLGMSRLPGGSVWGHAVPPVPEGRQCVRQVRRV